jgi:hypothetical protein
MWRVGLIVPRVSLPYRNIKQYHSLIMKLILAFFLFFSLGLVASAQQFGGFPSGTKWKQINTDTARIIFTPEAAEEAQRVATYY